MRLRPRFQTAILSNSFVGTREREHERYRFADLCDHLIYSHEVGVAKPDPRVYALTCERLGFTPQEIIFLDNDPAYITGARDYGMHAILFIRNEQAISDIEACIKANS